MGITTRALAWYYSRRRHPHSYGLWYAILGGADYYVDSVNGNDANDGLRPATAKKTLAAGAALLSAGKRLGLARGSVFKENVAITLPNCAVVAYGSGARPIIDCSDAVPSGNWTLAATTTNVYQASVTIATVSVSYFLNVWENGAFLTRATSLANCDATAGSYWFSSETGGPITLYVHATSGIPPTNGKTYEFSARDVGLLIDQPNTTVVSIETKRSLNYNGSLWVGDNSTVIDCIARDGSKHNLFVRQGSTVTNCLATNAYYGGQNTSLFIHYDDTATGGNVTYNNCTASCDTPQSLVSGFLGHAAAGNFGVVQYNNCTATNCGTAYNAGNCSEVDVVNCTSTGCSASVVPQTPICKIIGGTHSATGPTVSITSTNVALTVSGASISSGSGQSAIRSLVNGSSITVQNCSFPAWGGWMIQCTGTGSSLTASKNTYNSSIGFFGYYDLPASFGLNSDNNTFGIANHTSVVRINGTAYTTLASYQSATGQDLHSTALS